MTVGSPPSMTATTELVVPRSMPMILPIGVVAPVLLSGSVDASVDFGRFVHFVGCGVLGDGHQGRPDDAVAEPVPPAQLIDDLAARAPGPRHVGHGLVLAGVEPHARGCVDRAHALALKQQAQLAIDRRDALYPGLVDAIFRLMRDRQVEVVGQGEHLADQALGGEAEHGLPLLARPALEVRELGPLPLERGEVLVTLTGELLDVALRRPTIAALASDGRRDARRAAGARGAAAGDAGLEPCDLLAGDLGLASCQVALPGQSLDLGG